MTGAMPIEHRSLVKRTVHHDGAVWWRATCGTCRWIGIAQERDAVVAAAGRHRYPALNYLLLLDKDRHYDTGGPDSSCVDCPFRDPALSYEERCGGYIDNDPTEAHYDCRLLGEKVWGEYAPCSDDDWRRQARKELDLLSGHVTFPAAEDTS